MSTNWEPTMLPHFAVDFSSVHSGYTLRGIPVCTPNWVLFDPSWRTRSPQRPSAQVSAWCLEILAQDIDCLDPEPAHSSNTVEGIIYVCFHFCRPPPPPGRFPFSTACRPPPSSHLSLAPVTSLRKGDGWLVHQTASLRAARHAKHVGPANVRKSRLRVRWALRLFWFS